MLGSREPEVYGPDTLDDVIKAVRIHVGDQAEVRDSQSNVEGTLIDSLQDAADWADGVVFNPGGFSHTSVALRDAIVATGLPVIETHMSNVHAREEFRHQSITAGVCLGVVAGFGASSYLVAVDALIRHLDDSGS